jgi:hypothetical protein
MRSRLRQVSVNLRPSGAMSRSWKHQKGAPSLTLNSKAARSVASAFCIGLPALCHGRTQASGPNMSAPLPFSVCQNATAKRRCSAIGLPRTIRFASYQRNASGFFESGPS